MNNTIAFKFVFLNTAFYYKSNDLQDKSNITLTSKGG